MKKSILEKQFLLLLRANKLPIPEREVKLNQNRKWRYDFVWRKKKIIVELEGGIFIGGRHSRGVGMLKDMEKYNWAVINGWKLLRYSTNNLTNAIKDIKLLL